ncbi:hypothetical protein [Ramlibacter sp. AN1133]|uniref:hypothetical protein n=1 Tax=Ramlibacter sp. AN1133 TaxID=3133429 RepID=UPI0030C5E75C
MLSAAHTSESFHGAIARRTLSQELSPHLVGEAAARREVVAFAPHLAPLAGGFEVTPQQANEALVGLQMGLADDVRFLFPNDPAMEHVSAQIEAKATVETAQSQRPRER